MGEQMNQKASWPVRVWTATWYAPMRTTNALLLMAWFVNLRVHGLFEIRIIGPGVADRRLYHPMEVFMSEDAWAAVALALAAISVVAVAWPPLARFALCIATGWWGFVSVMFATAVPHGLTWELFVVYTYLLGREYIRLGHINEMRRYAGRGGA